MDAEHYRDDLTAALLRIEQLEHELELFRADPAHERVDIAEERLARARSQRQRAQRLLPRVLIASFAAMGAFALTDPTLPQALRVLGYAASGFGAVATVVTMAWLLALSAQGPRPAKLAELERQLRIAKGDVGARREARLRVEASTTAESEEAHLTNFHGNDAPSGARAAAR